MEVLLGLLNVEPMSGYDLGQTIRGSIGHFWNESYGQIYPNLKRLAVDGLVVSKTQKQKGKPDRHIYSITKKGRERLARWLAVPPQAEIPRNELLLKLFFGSQLSPEIAIEYVEHMAESERKSLQLIKRAADEIAQNQQYPDAPYWKMAARFGEMELEAHQRWAEETLAELKKLSRKRRIHTETGKEKKHASQ
jgi:DNA-binding PadR family transcriptional regulator